MQGMLARQPVRQHDVVERLMSLCVP